ncbi:MAG TPA: hypothetical protein VHU80_00830, partial [Polyangiaceae bacterium]|nr:hypothetical protein [Polyangiaceae bacterium]
DSSIRICFSTRYIQNATAVDRVLSVSLTRYPSMSLSPPSARLPSALCRPGVAQKNESAGSPMGTGARLLFSYYED